MYYGTINACRMAQNYGTKRACNNIYPFMDIANNII
jgi:hypothetical protein